MTLFQQTYVKWYHNPVYLNGLFKQLVVENNGLEHWDKDKMMKHVGVGNVPGFCLIFV